MKISSSKREILNILYEQDNWVELYSLHQKYRLSPGVVAEFVSVLIDNKLIVANELSVKLTNAGRHWMYLNRKKIFYDVSRTWAVANLKNEVEMKINNPYMPRLVSIDKKFFEKIS